MLRCIVTVDKVGGHGQTPSAAEEKPPRFLTTDWLLGAFADNRVQTVPVYRRYVADGIDAPSPWLELKNQVYLGSEHFVQRTLAMMQ